MSAGAAPISPCTSICKLDPATGWCQGCFRTAPEIAGWLDKSDAVKAEIIARVAERRRRAGVD